MKFLALLIVLGLAQGEAVAQVMRWVDDEGVVNYGTAVPERYRKNATVVDIPHPPTETQQREAEIRQKKEREVAARPPALPAPKPGGDTAKAVEPPSGSKEDESCAEQWRRFDAAWECFNPYRNANGSVKPEGFERCPEVIQPECRQ